MGECHVESVQEQSTGNIMYSSMQTAFIYDDTGQAQVQEYINQQLSANQSIRVLPITGHMCTLNRDGEGDQAVVITDEESRIYCGTMEVSG